MSPPVPDPRDPARGGDNDLLDRAIEETRRTREVVLAAAFVAINGSLFLMQAIQFIAFFELYGTYRYAPPVLLVVGVALIVLASRIYAQRLWAVVAATAVSGGSALALGSWYLVVTRTGRLAPLATLLPFASAIATVCAIAAIGACRRTAAARRRAAQAGLDLDL
jgi:hypothetical protein